MHYEALLPSDLAIHESVRRDCTLSKVDYENYADQRVPSPTPSFEIRQMTTQCTGPRNYLQRIGSRGHVKFVTRYAQVLSIRVSGIQ